MHTASTAIRARHRGLTALAFVVVAALAAGTGAWASHSFDDVPDSNPFHDDIAWMADNDIATGFADGGFHPSAAVSRQAMSAFMHRESNFTLDRAVGERAVVPAAAVNAMDPTKPFTVSSEGFVQGVGAAGTTCGVAPIYFPDDADLLDLGFTGVDNGAGEVGVTLRAEQLFGSSSPLVLAEAFTAGASGTPQHPFDVVTTHNTDVFANAYYVEICVTNSLAQDYQFFHAQVSFDIDS